MSKKKNPDDVLRGQTSFCCLYSDCDAVLYVKYLMPLGDKVDVYLIPQFVANQLALSIYRGSVS